MKISVIQMNAGADKNANLTQARELVSAAVAADGPDMVVLPETFSYIGGTVDGRRAAAEPLPTPGETGGETYETLRGLAREHGVFVHGGSFLERDGDSCHNTTVAFDRTGAELARYRKLHLFDVTAPDGTEYRESDIITGGSDVVTYQADGLTIGCSICYDLRFGELYRALAERGAQVIMVPSAFTMQTGKDHWELLVRARAVETETYVVAPDQVGQFLEGNSRRTCWGHSMIVDPWGHILAQAQDKTGFASAHVDLEYLAAVRARIPVDRHRVL
ncbi:MAG: carbon-nitrogen hydrolase family protein [Alphaproteobacteria bacterium]